MQMDLVWLYTMTKRQRSLKTWCKDILLVFSASSHLFILKLQFCLNHDSVLQLHKIGLSHVDNIKNKLQLPPAKEKSWDKLSCKKILLLMMHIKHEFEWKNLIILKEFYVAALLQLFKIRKLSMKERRSLMALAAAPCTKEQMKGWYLKYADCPGWWLSTGKPWCSPNHQRGEEKHCFSVNELDTLIHAYKNRKLEEVRLASKHVYFTSHQHQWSMHLSISYL